ncbi:hypothetical protein RRG08_013732 [Elysia crispata]|uniref:Uncharacterized protein n=1 Tax=Elysia crispata TaxID=231223 RepID=A0AAE1DKH6_9GAST|nr:hypothetical protein RRG08_013732 [Elysia crispata]
MRSRNLSRKSLEANFTLDKIIESAKAMTLVDRDLETLRNRRLNTSTDHAVQALYQHPKHFNRSQHQKQPDSGKEGKPNTS